MISLITAQQDAAPVVFAGGMMLVSFLIGIALLAFHIWALVDAIQNRNLNDTERLIWILVIIFVGCIGPILYFAIGRKKTPG